MKKLAKVLASNLYIAFKEKDSKGIIQNKKESSSAPLFYSGDLYVEIQSAIYEGEVIPFTTTAFYTNAKVMVWDNLASLKPTCNVKKLQ